MFDLKRWAGKPNEMLPKAIIAFHAVAINTNLQKNEGTCLQCVKIHKYLFECSQLVTSASPLLLVVYFSDRPADFFFFFFGPIASTFFDCRSYNMIELYKLHFFNYFLFDFLGVGILVKYHTMKAGPEGDIVSIRISQQLL